MASKLIFDISFDDITLIEGDGDFNKIKEIMENEDVKVKKWMLKANTLTSCSDSRSNQTVSEASAVLQFYYNGEVHIMEYSTSTGDVFYNPDIRELLKYLMEKGWKSLIPHPFLVDENLKFWRFFWDSGVVESPYLDKKIGKFEEEPEDAEEDG